MQVTPTAIVVKGAEEGVTRFENPTVLLGDFGVWVKDTENNTLTLFTWERVVQIEFNDAEAVKKVWEEAVLTVFEDLLDELDDYTDEPEEATPTPTPESETESSADDPAANPYE